MSSLLYTLVSPTWLLIPEARHGPGGLEERAFVVATALIPLVLVVVHFAAVERIAWAIFGAPVALSALILMDWRVEIGLTLGIGAYFLAFSKTDIGYHGPTLAGVGVISFLLTAPWLTPLALQTVRSNLPVFDSALFSHRSLSGWLVFDVGALTLYFLFRRFGLNRWLQFWTYFAFFCGVVELGRQWFGWHLLPYSELLDGEFDLAMCGLAGYLLFSVATRWRATRYALVFGLVLLVVFQVSRLHKTAKLQPTEVDITERPEYRMAKWYDGNMRESRLFAPGSSGRWLDAFADIPQVTGCCDGSVPLPEFGMANWAITTGQNAGEQDVAKSLLWLKAYGADALVVSPDYWKPNKFDNVLPVLWREGDYTIYDLQRSSRSLAHAISPAQVIHFIPENGLDTEVIEPYVKAIEDTGGSQLGFEWLNAHHATIHGKLTSGQIVSVQIGYDEAWHASALGKPASVYPDALGMLVIDPRCQGQCSIDLEWGSAARLSQATGLQLIGAASLLIWGTARRFEFWRWPRKTIAFGLKKIIRTQWSLFVVIAALAYFLFRTAWIAEDAYISFRVIDNFLAGCGLTWNVGERVQVYTDPLFVGVLALFTWLFGHVYFVTITISIVLTLTAVFLIMSRSKLSAILLAFTALLLSKGFLDFSVSGLENPLTHLLIALFLLVYWRREDPFLLSLIAALAATNRMDSMLFFLPALAVSYFRTGWKVCVPALLGWSPFIAWSGFSLFYYGFLFPNTAYAKLNLGLSAKDVIWQGISYYSALWQFDTASALVIGLGMAVACLYCEWALVAGIALNLLYILRVGGDYMIGRFFTGAVFMSVAILARYWRTEQVVTIAAAFALVAAGLSIPAPTVTSARADFGEPWPVNTTLGIADERAYWYPCSGLLRYLNRKEPVMNTHLTRASNAYWMSCDAPGLYDRVHSVWPEARVARMGADLERLNGPARAVVISHNIGMFGYFAGRNTHILDDMALGDALMSRMPVVPGKWAAGNYLREIPAGYLNTLRDGRNEIEDPGTAEYYEHLRTVITGDLWSMHRMKQILSLNTGAYDYLLPQHKLGFAVAPPNASLH